MRALEIDRQTLVAGRKASLRAEAAGLRRKIWLTSGEIARRDLAARGVRLIASKQCAAAIGGYAAIRDELDPLPLLLALHERGLRICLPSTHPGPALIFREWTPGSPLQRGKYGIQEPGESQPELIPELLLVPLLAFDRKGNRLGYGAGYYDAVLRNLRARGPVFAIGAGFDEQEFAEIPREPQDEPLDAILTPSRVIVCGE